MRLGSHQNPHRIGHREEEHSTPTKYLTKTLTIGAVNGSCDGQTCWSPVTKPLGTVLVSVVTGRGHRVPALSGEAPGERRGCYKG
jgi:hypothetical protein